MAMKSSRVSYEQNEHFFLCRKCQTHIALHTELIHKYDRKDHALFKNLVNVYFAESYEMITGQHVSPAYCTSCDTEVGQKFVELKIRTFAIKNGTFSVDMTKLLLWKENKMVYADTEQPVKD